MHRKNTIKEDVRDVDREDATIHSGISWRIGSGKKSRTETLRAAQESGRDSGVIGGRDKIVVDLNILAAAANVVQASAAVRIDSAWKNTVARQSERRR